MTPQQLLLDIAEAGEVYARFVESLSPASLTRRMGGDSWSVAQLSGHVAEYPSFWAERAVQILANPQEQFGRTHDHEGRMAAIPSLVHAQPAEMATAVRHAFATCLNTLGTLPLEAWTARVYRMTGEELSMLEAIEALVLTHTRDHMQQARESSVVTAAQGASSAS